MYTSIGNPRFQAFDANGVPLAGGKLYAYHPFTMSPKYIYDSDQNALTLGDPVILDSYGSAALLADSATKIIVKDENDVVVYTNDNIINPSSDRGPLYGFYEGEDNGFNYISFYNEAVGSGTAYASPATGTLYSSGGSAIVALGDGGIGVSLASPIPADVLVGTDGAGTQSYVTVGAGLAFSGGVSSLDAATAALTAGTISGVTFGNNTLSGATNNLNTTLSGLTVSPSTVVGMSYGGTGANLVDPNADRILFWDDSAGQVTWLVPAASVTISGTTLSGPVDAAAGSTTQVQYSDGAGGLSASSGVTYDGTQIVTATQGVVVGGSAAGVARFSDRSPSLDYCELAAPSSIATNMQLYVIDFTADSGTRLTSLGAVSGGISTLDPSGSWTADTSPQPTSDYVLTYDTSASTFKKVKPSNLLYSHHATFRAYLNSNQTIATGTTTRLSLGAESWDSHSYYNDPVNYRFTPGVAGYYVVSLIIYMQSFANGAGLASYIHKNGSLYAYSYKATAQANDNAICCRTFVYLNGSTDYLDFHVLHNTGVNETALAGSHLTAATATLVRYG